MILTRRTILRGLLTAPIVCGAGVLMPLGRLREFKYLLAYYDNWGFGGEDVLETGTVFAVNAASAIDERMSGFRNHYDRLGRTVPYSSIEVHGAAQFALAVGPIRPQGITAWRYAEL